MSKNQYYKHPDTIPPTIGDKYTFFVTPTGLGPFLQVQCNVCKEKLELTDIDSL